MAVFLSRSPVLFYHTGQEPRRAGPPRLPVAGWRDPDRVAHPDTAAFLIEIHDSGSFDGESWDDVTRRAATAKTHYAESGPSPPVLLRFRRRAAREVQPHFLCPFRPHQGASACPRS